MHAGCGFANTKLLTLLLGPTEDGGPLIDIIISIVIVTIFVSPKASLIRLLERELPANELTVREVIDDEANRLTIPSKESLLRKVLGQMHLEPLDVFDK